MDLAHTRTLRGHVGAVLCARYTDGTYAVTCGADRSVKLWNPKREAPTTGALLIKTYEGPHSKEVSSVAVADDSARRTVKLWDLRSQSRRALQTIEDFKDSVTAIAVAARKDAAGPKRPNGRGAAPERGTRGVPVTSVALSRDGACVAASCLDSSARLLELDSGAQLNLYTGHAHCKYALECTFSHNDAHLASGSEDGAPKVWRLVEATVAADLAGAHKAAATSLAWHPRQADVLVASHDGTVSLWEKPP
ncbi:hypothetical protein JL721_1973 [Aureococcus anophagefferens]|nr:hypothetical protein JL721_1973 [Aureococcus anophagefferens]